jgi:hypothetical protein
MIPMQPLMQWIGKSGYHAYNVTRGVLGAFYLLLLGMLLARWRPASSDLPTGWLLIVAMLYMLSPTQFPWYFTWVIPFLAIRPWPAVTLYTVTLPLYYFQHALSPGNGRWWFDNVIVWLEHAPIFLYIIVSTIKDRNAPLRYFGRRSRA